MTFTKRTVIVITVFMAIAAANGSSADTNVVFGSYLNVRFAQERIIEVADALGVRPQIVAVDINGVRYHRVVSPAGLSTAEVAHLVERAFLAGPPNAWVLHTSGALVAAKPAVVVTATDDAPREASIARASAGPATPPEPVSTGDDWQLTLRSPTDAADTIAVPRFTDDELDIRIDGRLAESIWASVPGYDNMVVIEPDTLADVRYRTIARYFYTERGMYVGAWLEQPPETLLARLSSRDDYINRDSFGLTLDTSGEGLYGYWFTVNLGGSVMDGKVAPEREFTREWDGPWNSATAELSDGWSVEMFLPWSMMTMPQASGDRVMGFWANRKVAYIDERWSWPALPFTGARFMSALNTMKMPGVVPKQQLALFPYMSATYDNSYEDDEYTVGADVFWRPSSNLQLTAALNPDFGAVESDDVVINLTSTETFFPEKRLFFLEGNEIFTTSPRAQVRGFGGSGGSSSAGARRTSMSFTPTPTTVLNTRRIGGKPIVTIPVDVTVPGPEQARPADLLGAAKVTGQSGPFRYGVLTAFEDDPELRGTMNGQDVIVEGDGRNFGVVRGLYESTGAGRQSIGYIGTIVDHPEREAIVHGLDGHILSASGKLKVDTQLLYSDVDGIDGYGGFADVNYTQRRGVVHSLGFDYFDDTLDINDLGFLGRNDLWGVRYAFMYSRSNLRYFRQWRSGINVGHWLNTTDNRVVRSGIFARNSLMFHNRSEIRAELNFFPARWDDIESRGNGSYKIGERWVGQLGFGTDTSKVVSYSVQAGIQQENVDGWQYQGGVGITYKPTDRFSFDFDVNYRYREAWLLHQGGRDFTSFKATDWQPRLAIDLFFTARQQLRFTMQWAGIRADEKDFYQVPIGDGDLIPVTKPPGEPSDDFAISRLTTQLRYRWEIAPMSDLFVVYTRGSNVLDQVDESFEDLFVEAWTEPVIDIFIVKLRYRFGS